MKSHLSAGVFHHSGIKIPFFAHDSGKRVKETPLNMLIAMVVSAVLCVIIGVWLGPLYATLPYHVNYDVYTTSYVVTQLQLLLFSSLAFIVLTRIIRELTQKLHITGYGSQSKNMLFWVR